MVKSKEFANGLMKGCEGEGSVIDEFLFFNFCCQVKCGTYIKTGVSRKNTSLKVRKKHHDCILNVMTSQCF